jgi:6-phosphogluconolactonase (cycloisomerase 2 family)
MLVWEAIIVRWLFTLSLIALISGPTSLANDKPFLVGNYKDTLDGFQHLGDILIAADHTIYAVDRTARLIRKFDAKGNSLGTLEKASSHLSRPVGLAFHQEQLVVVDQGDHRIKCFAKDGELVATLGGRGKGTGAFFHPSSVASDGEHLFIADTGNHRVIQTDREGKLWRVFGSGFGNGEGQMISPTSVAVNPNPQGRIYVADSGNNRILVFRADGTLEKSWGSWGGFDDMLDEPTDLTWRHNHLYVTDRRNHRIHTLTADMQRLDTWGLHELIPHEGNGKLHYPRHFDIAPDRSFALVAEPVEDRIQRFISRDAAPPPEEEMIYVPSNSKRNRTHFAAHLSTDGQLLLMIEPENHFLVLFDLRLDVPVVICKFSERGQGFGLMMDAHSPVLDAQSGRIFVADRIKRRIQEFRFEYDPQASLGYRSDLVSFARAFDYQILSKRITSKLDWPFDPQHMALGPDRLLYMLDQRNQLIAVFDQELKYKRSFKLKLPEDTPSQLSALTLNAAGQLWISDSDASRVHLFDQKGKLEKTLDLKAPLQTPFGVTLDQNGHIFVSDRDSHQIAKFGEDGSYLKTFATRGAWMGELWKPKGLVVDSKNRIIVVDQGNHRGQIFDDDGKWLVTFGMGRAYTHNNPPRRPDPESGARKP